MIDHPEVLGDNVLTVCSQYDGWMSNSGDLARGRLDVLGLDSSGQLVVVERKRGSDSKIHLQGITYAALVASFTEDTFADAHPQFRHAHPLQFPKETPWTGVGALSHLEAHVEEGWDADLLTRPKIVLIAEDVPAQTYTTVRWLADLAPDLDIELHSVSTFVFDENSQSTCVVFQRQFPMEDTDAGVLTADSTGGVVGSVSTEVAQRKRNARSTHVIVDNDPIPVGTQVDLDLRTILKTDVLETVHIMDQRGPRTRTGNVGLRPQSSLATVSRTRRCKHLVRHKTRRTPSGIRDHRNRATTRANTGNDQITNGSSPLRGPHHG